MIKHGCTQNWGGGGGAKVIMKCEKLIYFLLPQKGLGIHVKTMDAMLLNTTTF